MAPLIGAAILGILLFCLAFAGVLVLVAAESDGQKLVGLAIVCAVVTFVAITVDREIRSDNCQSEITEQRGE